MHKTLPTLSLNADQSNPTSLFASPRETLQKRQQAWMVGLNYQTWLEQIYQRQQVLQEWIERQGHPRILLVQSEPLELLAGFMAACLCDCPVFFGNPNWQYAEWQQVLALVKPHIIWDQALLPQTDVPEPTSAKTREKGWIMVPTGGSSGQIRFAIHTWSTLAAAVEGCQRHFFANEPGAINSCCWLPLYHVSGLMQFMRSLLTQGNLILLPKGCFAPDSTIASEIALFLDPHSEQPHQYFLSLVPTQLQRLLGQNHLRLQWLARFRTILVGGAPAWPSLLQAARQHDLPIALTYGMTETAAQVSTLDPEHFLMGAAHNGQVLPHTQITIEDEQHRPLPAYQTGQVVIQGSSLCKGYYPHKFTSAYKFFTDDLGYFNDQGDLHIIGRLSRKIISGGENIFPEEIEAVLLGTGMVKDATVFGQPHPDWGQAITAVVVPSAEPFSLAELKKVLQQQLSAFKQPKQWYVLATLSRNPQGKIDQSQIRKALYMRD